MSRVLMLIVPLAFGVGVWGCGGPGPNVGFGPEGEVGEEGGESEDGGRLVYVYLEDGGVEVIYLEGEDTKCPEKDATGGWQLGKCKPSK